MEKKIINVQIESEHGMPEGLSQEVYKKLEGFVGSKYSPQNLKDNVEGFIASKGPDWQHSYLCQIYGKGNKYTCMINTWISYVKYTIELEDISA